jgi:hypothetical protein
MPFIVFALRDGFIGQQFFGADQFLWPDPPWRAPIGGGFGAVGFGLNGRGSITNSTSPFFTCARLEVDGGDEAATRGRICTCSMASRRQNSCVSVMVSRPRQLPKSEDRPHLPVLLQPCRWRRRSRKGECGQARQRHSGGQRPGYSGH